MQADVADQKFDGLKYRKVDSGHVHYLINELSPLLQADALSLGRLFDPNFIKEHALHCTAKGGRGQTLIFELDKQLLSNANEGQLHTQVQEPSMSDQDEDTSVHWCYRQYLRGGLIGKVIKRSFLRCSSHAHRSYDEFKMLMKMRLLGLPVPRPIVACEHVGLCSVHNEIIIEEIQGTQNLAEVLSVRPLNEAELSSIGVTLYHFFKFNVHHTDLNLRNILLDNSGNCYVIDFDKCAFEANTFNSVLMVTKMFDRLERSFNKAMELEHIHHYQSEMFKAVKKTTLGLLAEFFENTEEMLSVDLPNRPAEGLVKLDLNLVDALLGSD